MHFKDYLEDSKKEIEKEMSIVFNGWEKEIAGTKPKLLPLFQALVGSMTGGKKLRGTLVKLGYSLINPNPPPEIIKASLAYEIFQTSILIHDDIIDRSELRRGKKSLYTLLGADHYGISQAICLGDLGFFLSLKLFNSLDFPKTNKEMATRLFIQTMQDTVLGEMADIQEAGKKLISEKKIIDIYRSKTALYTIIGPMQLGAVLAGADKKILTEIRNFGENLGIAFQIYDDIIGVFGQKEITGKSASSDIKEGKATLLLIEARKQVNQKQLDILDKYYGQDKVTENEAEIIRKVFIETGALTCTEEKAKEYMTEAKAQISTMKISSNMRKILFELVDDLTNRVK